VLPFVAEKAYPAYFSIFFLETPAIPAKPKPRRSMEEGSAT
jgi:hypothetical protein